MDSFSLREVEVIIFKVGLWRSFCIKKIDWKDQVYLEGGKSRA